MTMFILSETQVRIIADSLKTIQEHQLEVRSILETAQHVVLESKKSAPKEDNRTDVVRAAKTQRKTRGTRGKTALNDAKALVIKQRLAEGATVRAVAKEFGVHITTINNIKWGKTYKHVQLQQTMPVAVAV
jgi:hypothetical protein